MGIVLGLGRLDRIVEHEPGDLTATVQAGVTFARLQAALRERGQWLSLDPARRGPRHRGRRHRRECLGSRGATCTAPRATSSSG